MDVCGAAERQIDTFPYDATCLDGTATNTRCLSI